MFSNHENKKEMNFSKSDLLEKIRENRKKHIKEYSDSVNEYKLKLSSLLSEKIRELNESATDLEKVPTGTVRLKNPVCYVDQYDQYIDMLEMTEDETIPMSMSLFNQLVRDQWDWKRDFELTKASYSM